MNRLTKEGIAAWNARSDEIIKCGPSVSEERAKEIRDMYPPMSEAEIEEILRKYKA